MVTLQTTNFEEENFKTFIDGNDNNLYELNILKEIHYINIKCHNTIDDRKQIYSYKLKLKDIQNNTNFNNLSQVFNFFKSLDNRYISIEKEENYISLILRIKNNKNPIIFQLEKEYEEKDIQNFNDAKKRIQELSEENKELKRRIIVLENNFKKLDEYFKNYKDMMEKNYIYNLFDIKSYELDNIFNNLYSNIIKTKEEFGLINMGIRKLFNRNIIYFQNKYESKEDKFDSNPPSKNFSEIFDILDYSILVILTKDNKKFGAFINNKKKQENINDQNNNNYMINQNNNNLKINQNNNNFMVNQNNNNLVINQNNNPFRVNQNNNNLIINKNNKFGMIPINKNIQKYNFNVINAVNSNNFIHFFDSKSSLGEYFIFSLDKMKIYYSNEQNEGNIRFPNFNFKYDSNRQSLFGNEYYTNNYTENNTINSSNVYKLSERNEFNIEDCELFEVSF